MDRKLPTQFSQTTIVTKYELIKYFRGKKIHAILGVSIAIPLLLILIPELFGLDDPENELLYLTTLLGVLFFLIVIIASFFGCNTLVSEFHDKTGYTLFPNPINRTSIWAGKFIAAELVSFASIGVFYFVISIVTFYKYETLPDELFLSLLFSFVVITCMLSFAFLASSIFRSSMSATVVMILLLIILLPLTDQLQMNLVETKPWHSISFSSGIISNVLTVPYPIDLNPNELPKGPFDTERFVPYIFESLIVFAVYICVCTLSSLLIFKSKQL